MSKEEIFLAEMGIHPETVIEGDYLAKYKLKGLLKTYAKQSKSEEVEKLQNEFQIVDSDNMKLKEENERLREVILKAADEIYLNENEMGAYLILEKALPKETST